MSEWASVGQRRNGNGNELAEVVTLRPVNLGRFAHTVTQEDLVELQVLGQQLNDARVRYLGKRDWIKAALRGGAAVEPGFLTAELVLRQRPAYRVEDGSYDHLVVHPNTA